MNARKSKPAEFETSLQELEAIVRQLEEEETPLAKSLELFARGQELARRCEKDLREAENQVRVLLENPDGEIAEAPFDAENAPIAEPELEEAAPQTSAKRNKGDLDLPF